ncbi:MAG: hypothetical protein WCV90_02890 [Candidatus Woesearchaeota archaeon]
MGTQINLRLSDELLLKAQDYSNKHGFDNVQEFIKETIRERLFNEPSISDAELKLVLKLADAVKRDKKLLGTREELNSKLKRSA